MKKQILKILSLLVAFVGAVIYFSLQTNSVKEEQTMELKEPTLPLVYFMTEDVRINELHGYTKEMDLLAVRDSITPIVDNRQLTVCMDTCGREIDRISCDIYTTDGINLVASEGRLDYQIHGQEATAVINLPNQIEPGKEYLMELTAISGSEKTYFYTRIVKSLGWNTEDCISFAEEFHKNTFSTKDQTVQFFLEYLDGNGSSAGDFVCTDMDSTISQVMWGQLDVKPMTEPQISVKETNSSYTVVCLSYVAEASDENQEVRYLTVEENYRLRYTPQHVFLLNYERLVDTVFDPDTSFGSENGEIQLGIGDGDMEYMTNEAGNITAFVQNGELWSYDFDAGTIARIFSFRNGDCLDSRSNWPEHEIRIVNVDEVGNIDFFVFGYMNRGSHEGECAVILYHYDTFVHTIQEEACLPSDASYAHMKADTGSFLCESVQGDIYKMDKGRILKFSTALGQAEVLTDAVESQGSANRNTCLLSDNRQYLAWSEKDFSQINLCNMKSGKQLIIESGKNETISPLTFIGEDLVYGVINPDREETWLELRIVEISGDGTEILKTFAPRNQLIGSVLADGDILRVTLLLKDSDIYTVTGTETIMNHSGEGAGPDPVQKIKQGSWLNQVVIKTGKSGQEMKPQLITSREIKNSYDPQIIPPQAEEISRYYVYAYGNVVCATGDFATAITEADASMGMVLDNHQNCIWSRVRNVTMEAFSCADLPEKDQDAAPAAQALGAVLKLEGSSKSASELLAKEMIPQEILTQEIPGAEVYDLKGCNAESLLYFVSKKHPVICLSANQALLLNGYSADKIWYYDLSDHKQYSVKYSEAEKTLANGFHFFAYD